MQAQSAPNSKAESRLWRQAIRVIGAVRGAGLFIGVEIVDAQRRSPTPTRPSSSMACASAAC